MSIKQEGIIRLSRTYKSKCICNGKGNKYFRIENLFKTKKNVLQIDSFMIL